MYNLKGNDRMEQSIINKITQSIIENIKSALTKGQFDKTFKAKVTEVSNGKIKVLYCNNTYTASSSITCKEGDYVMVCAPCNNWQELFVITKTK